MKAVIEQYKQRALENVSRTICPNHGGKVELTLYVKNSSEHPSIEIHATSCCDEFAQKAVEVAQ